MNIVWKHEVRQADKIARKIIQVKGVNLSLRIFLLPIFIKDLFYFKKSLYLTKKNLLFTKRLAFNAAKDIQQGKTRAWAMRNIEIKTKDIMDKDKKGLYTGKIRRKQLSEIRLLTDHYLRLLDAKYSRYPEKVKSAYPDRESYLSFLDRLQKAEHEVTQAAASVRKGCKKERLRWFKRLNEVTREVRMGELAQLFY